MMEHYSYFMFCLVVLSLLQGNFTNGDVYYIAPSLTQNTLCLQQSCPTFSQLLATRTDSNSHVHQDVNTTLVFLPGKHHLDRKFTIEHVYNFSMIPWQSQDPQNSDTVAVIIECASQSVRFEISQTTFVSIKGLHFIGCGGNTVTQVVQFVVEDTIFEGVKGSGTALALNDTVGASIVRSIFLSNTLGSLKERGVRSLAILRSLLTDLDLNRTAERVGGAVSISFSTVLIDEVTFKQNRADVGAAVFVEIESYVLIKNSQFVNNEANISGSALSNVLFVDQGSTVQISSCTFDHNVFVYGAISILHSSMNISNCLFTNNIAYGDTGAIFVYALHECVNFIMVHAHSTI